MQVEQPERALPGVVFQIGGDHQNGNEASKEKEQIAVKDLGEIAKGAGHNRGSKGNQNAGDA